MGEKIVLFILFLFIDIVLFVTISILLFIKNAKLMLYLKHNNNKLWSYLTTIGNYGPGGSNPIRFLKYIYGVNNKQDNVISQLKNSIKIWFPFWVITGLLLIISLELLRRLI